MAGNVGGEGEDEIVGINVTPLVDIVLVLLIIFMVTANMIVRETVEVDLPSPAKTTEPDPKAPVMVTMDKAGKVFVDGVEAPEGQLVTKLKEAGKDDPKARAVIDADPALDYAKVVNLIDIVKEAGISKFALNLKKEAATAAPAAPAEGAPAPAPAPSP